MDIGYGGFGAMWAGLTAALLGVWWLLGAVDRAFRRRRVRRRLNNL